VARLRDCTVAARDNTTHPPPQPTSNASFRAGRHAARRNAPTTCRSDLIMCINGLQLVVFCILEGHGTFELRW
jgi:hypothetical protein